MATLLVIIIAIIVIVGIATLIVRLSAAVVTMDRVRAAKRYAVIVELIGPNEECLPFVDNRDQHAPVHVKSVSIRSGIAVSVGAGGAFRQIHQDRGVIYDEDVRREFDAMPALVGMVTCVPGSGSEWAYHYVETAGAFLMETSTDTLAQFFVFRKQVARRDRWSRETIVIWWELPDGRQSTVRWQFTTVK